MADADVDFQKRISELRDDFFERVGAHVEGSEIEGPINLQELVGVVVADLIAARIHIDELHERVKKLEASRT
jgi:hypothetical protein